MAGIEEFGKNRKNTSPESDTQGPLKPFNQDARHHKAGMRGAPVPTTHIVESGDTLTNLAQTYLGDANRWPEIIEANKDQIPNPPNLHKGQELIIPK